MAYQEEIESKLDEYKKGEEETFRIEMTNYFEKKIKENHGILREEATGSLDQCSIDKKNIFNHIQ